MSFSSEDNFQISYGEDKIIRVKDRTLPQRFPGGIGAVLFNRMKQHANKVAQIDGPTGKTQTYSDLLQRSIRTAIQMRSRGIKQKDIVTICSHNHLDTVVPLYAASFLGAIAAPLDPRLSLNDTTYLIKEVRPKMFFISENAVSLIEDAITKVDFSAEIVVFGDTERHSKFSEFLETCNGEEEFLPEENVDDMETAIILFSSGTTGLPKGVCLSHYAYLNRIVCYRKSLAQNIKLVYSSLYWMSGYATVISSTVAGDARLVAWNFECDKTWYYIQRYKVTMLFLVTNDAADFCKAGCPSKIDNSSLRLILVGGERTSATLIRDLRNMLPGVFVIQVYGQTETAGISTSFNIQVKEQVDMLRRKPDSCGRPMPDFDAYKIIDVVTGKTLGPYQHGELRIKGRFLMKGYYNRDSSCAYDEGGFFKTGDIVYFDEEFCFFIVDRIKEILKYRCWQVPPAMIEEVLLTHPAVDAAVVVGVPHEEDGDHAMACVLLKRGVKRITEEDIKKYVDERVDDMKRLRAGVIFVRNFPTTVSGKINRRLLRELYLRRKQ